MSPDVRDEPDHDRDAGVATDRSIERDPDELPDDEPIDDDPNAVAAAEAPVWERADWIALAVILLASVVLVGLHVRAFPTLSPIDELQHIDYTIKAGEFDVPRQGERVGFEAMSEAACRSVEAPQYVGPPCDLDEYDPNDFQERGFNTSATQFPPYYTVTGLISRGAVAVGIVGSQVTAARMVGALWAAAAWSIVWYIMALYRIPRLQRGIVVGALMVTPLTLFHASTVNADAVLMLTGAIAMLATVQYERGRLRGWWLPPIMIGLLFVEATNLLIIAACSAYLLVRMLPRRDIAPGWKAMPLALVVVAAWVRADAADRIRRWLFAPNPRPRTSDVAPMFEGRDPDVFTWTWSQVLEQLPSNFTPIGRAYVPEFMREQTTLASIQLTNWLLIGLLFVAAFVLVERASLAWWTRVGMLTMLVAGPFYTFYYAHFSTVFYPAPGRFGFPLLPLVAVVAASALTTRSARWVAGSIAVLSALNTLWFLVT